MSEYSDYLARKQHEYGDKFDASALAPQFAPYLHNGTRIEVDFGNGEIKRGTVGVTTGWKPCFLLMLRRDSIGSAWTLSADDKITRVIGSVHA